MDEYGVGGFHTLKLNIFAETENFHLERLKQFISML